MTKVPEGYWIERIVHFGRPAGVKLWRADNTFVCQNWDTTNVLEYARRRGEFAK